MTVDEFDKQLSYLKGKGYSTLSGNELISILQGAIAPDRSIVITFDDGYRDTWHLAAPILKKYGMCALLFVVTSKIKEVSNSLSADWSEIDDERYLSWDEIHSMSESGLFEIHTHTHSHKRYWQDSQSSLDVKKNIIDDIATSIDELKKHGYTHPMHLAWPWGYFRHDWLDDAAVLGVVAMYTVRPGTNFTWQSNKFIRRIAGERLNSHLALKIFILGNPVAGICLNVAASVWGYIRGRS